MRIREVLNDMELIANSVFGLKLINQLILDLAYEGSLLGDLDKNLWKMIKLESAMSDCRNGLTYKNSPDSGGLPISRIETISDGKINFSRVGYAALTEESNPNFLVKEGNILFSHINSIEQIGKVAFYEFGMNPLLHGMNLLRITPSKNYLPKFLFYMFKTSQIRNQVISKAKRSINQASINMKELRSIYLPMPPIDHQLKIVNQLDSLLLICSQLEMAIIDRDLAEVAFRKSAVDSISTAHSQEELQMAWERIKQNWEAIAGSSESIASLRQLLIDLAIQGQLFGRKLIGNHGYPSEWEVNNFKAIGNIEGGNQPPKSVFISEPRDGYIQLFQIRDLGPNPVPVFIPTESARSTSVEGEILIGRYGASVGKIFRAKKGAYNVALVKFIYPKEKLDSEFVYWFLKSSRSQTLFTGMSRSAQAGFNKRDLEPLLIPIPSKIEQQKIVEKLNTLMDICDELENALRESSELGEKFARSVVSVTA